MRGVPFGSNIVADTLGADKEDRKFSTRPLCIEMSKANGIVGAQCITAGTDVGHAVDLRWIEAGPREQVVRVCPHVRAASAGIVPATSGCIRSATIAKLLFCHAPARYRVSSGETGHWQRSGYTDRTCH